MPNIGLQYPSGTIPCMIPANESRRYNVTSTAICCVHTQNGPWAFQLMFTCIYGTHGHSHMMNAQHLAKYKCWPFCQCSFSVATMRNYLALALLAALVCYVTAAPRRPFRGPAMGRVPNPLDPMPSTHHERPHHRPHHGPHHRRPKVGYVARVILQFYPE